ncbi:WW domain-binding protein 4 [Amyelois transitella]|uniref:WW domain-binding protein 4 n=1 Tax=Amyelois transitella TaxID=680683 RepID=UPI00067A92EE|nr:WW domain-binding protein 4 [Amyelois transitella]
MTEYWKSQSRKYCDFCKCWFADNKVSISFHENGKRHKESVQKHISQLSKKSAKEFKQKEKMDDDIKKMEAAAMAAYLKDVQNNADLTSQSINEMLVQNGGDTKDLAVASSSSVQGAPVWHEVKGEDGSSYFWNKKTNETTWDPPDEYLSIAQQEEKKLKKEKTKDKEKKQKHKEKMKEVEAHVAREKMRELAATQGTAARPARRTERSTEHGTELGPAPRPVPYGSWTPVVQQPSESVDLQLPQTLKEPPPVVVEPERVRFSEKRVESLGEGPVLFKKRKLHARNARQKLDDD